MKSNEETMQIICLKCGGKESKIIRNRRGEHGECTNCHNITYKKSKQGQEQAYCLDIEQDDEFDYGADMRAKGIQTNIGSTPTHKSYPIVRCPYCNSPDTKKISSLSKAAGIAAFGVFALGRSTKQWHCNNCKSDF